MNSRVRVSLDASAVPASPGGAGRYVLDLASALDRRDDIGLTVVCRRDDADRWGQASPRARAVARAPKPRPLRLAWERGLLPGRPGLARLLGRLEVDVHHGPHYTMPRRSPVPVVVTIHDLSLLEHPEWHLRSKVAFFGSAIRLAATRADALIAVSAATADRLSHLLSPRAPIHVIPHGVDHARFRPEPGGGDGAALDRIGAVGPYVAFLGTVEPRKDVPNLVKAFDRIAPAHPDLTLVIAGSPGWGTEAVDAAVAASPFRSRILRPGYVPEGDIPAFLRGAAAVAYPSLEEGFGLPALESLACGTPLVTTTGSAMEEVAGDGALLVAPGDAAALAMALEALVNRGPEVEAQRRRGLATAAKFTWAASAAAHAAAYRGAL